jgi:hypothetical protein
VSATQRQQQRKLAAQKDDRRKEKMVATDEATELAALATPQVS